MTLPGQPDPLPVMDACRNLDLDGALLEDAPGPTAFGARRLDLAARATACRTGLGADELAEDTAADLLQPPRATAGRAGRDKSARFRAVAVTVRARHRDLERYVTRRSARRFDELDLHCCNEIGAARDAAEHVVAEERREEIGQAAEVEVARLEAAAAKPGVPVAVVELPRLRLREHLIGLDDFPEPLLRVRCFGDIGVQLAGERTECLLDVGLAGVARDAEKLVVVPLRLCHVYSDVSVRRRPTRRSERARMPRSERRRAPSRSPCARARSG